MTFFVVSFTLCFGVATTAAVTTYSTLVKATSSAVFNCTADNSTHTMNWRHTPMGCTEFIDFYFFGKIRDTEDEIYRSDFKVDNSVPGRYDLIIDNVDYRHAGKYECVSRHSVETSAELSVVGVGPGCYSEKKAGSTETEIICNVFISGNTEPKLFCRNESYNSSASFVSDSRGGASRERYTSTYLSTYANLSDISNVTTFTCAIAIDYTSEPLYSRIRVQGVHPDTGYSRVELSMRLETYVAGVPRGKVKPEYLVCAGVAFTIAGIVVGVYVWYRKRAKKLDRDYSDVVKRLNP